MKMKNLMFLAARKSWMSLTVPRGLHAPTTFGRIVVLIALALMFSATGFAQPIPHIWAEEVNGQLIHGTDTFSYSYWRSLFDTSITKHVEISFQKDTRDVWTDANWNDYISRTVGNIESLWNNEFSVRDNETNILYSCWLAVTTEGPVFNQTVTVHKVKLPGEDYDAGNWYVDEDEKDPYASSHELGHMIGLYDEYEGGWQDPENQLIDERGLMGFNEVTPTHTMRCRYYAQYREFLQSFDPEGSFSLVRLPEPATVLLLGLGGLALLRRRR